MAASHIIILRSNQIGKDLDGWLSLLQDGRINFKEESKFFTISEPGKTAYNAMEFFMVMHGI